MLEINDYESAIKRGQEAWARISRDTSWEEWQLVGVALEIGRQEAMNAAHVRKPIGGAYNAAMSAWLTKTGFDKIDKGDRSRLFKVMTNIDAITTWRQTLTLTERLKLNHPSSVLRKWKPKAGPSLHYAS